MQFEHATRSSLTCFVFVLPYLCHCLKEGSIVSVSEVIFLLPFCSANYSPVKLLSVKIGHVFVCKLVQMVLILWMSNSVISIDCSPVLLHHLVIQCCQLQPANTKFQGTEDNLFLKMQYRLSGEPLDQT